MNTKLPYDEVVAAYERKLVQAKYKSVSTVAAQTKKKYEGLICLYESTIHFLTNRITNINQTNGQSKHQGQG
jgi:hypothetical protein